MRRKGLSFITIGAITLVVIVVGSYLGFTKDIPFTKPFEIKAVFEEGNIRTGSPVRIAGVQVGKVQRVEAVPDTDTSVVTMAIQKTGLPLHTDATAKIRPRIFLEGNFFVELTTGTARAPQLDSGDTLKVTQTASPVQLDQVLSALQDDTRVSLKTTLKGISTALSDKPTAAQDARADASVQGLTGAQGLNAAYDDLGIAERDTSQLNEALLGEQPDRDLRRLISGLSRATEGLSRNQPALRDLVTNLSTTVGALAAEQDDLRLSIRRLGPTLQTTNRTLTSLNRAFPPIRGLATDLQPGVRETPEVIEAGFPWIRQVRPLVSQAELGGLVDELSPATRDVARVVDTTSDVFPEANDLSRCVADVVLPTGDVVLQDEFTSGQPNYREFAYVLAGLAGEGQNFDGNGQYVRLSPSAGPNAVSLGSRPAGTGLVGTSFPGLGTRPAKPSSKPPYDASVPCYRSQQPDLNGPAAARGSFGTVAPGASARQLSSKQEDQLEEADLDALRPTLRPFGTKRTAGEDKG